MKSIRKDDRIKQLLLLGAGITLVVSAIIEIFFKCSHLKAIVGKVGGQK